MFLRNHGLRLVRSEGKHFMHFPKSIILVLLAAALLMVGCDDDDPTCPGPEGTPPPTLANIWAQDDGTRR